MLTRLTSHYLVRHCSKAILQWKIVTSRLVHHEASKEERIAESLKKIEQLQFEKPQPSNLSSQSAPLTHQKFAGRKRFYKFVGVEPTPEENDKVIMMTYGI